MKYLITSLLLVPTSIAAMTPPTIKDYIRQAEIANNIPEGLVSALAMVESNFDHKAIVHNDGKSKRTSFGLLQIQLAAARQVGFKGNSKELMRPDINIKYGAKYLKLMLNMTNNDYAKAFTCYNSGMASNICKSNKYSTYAGKVFNAYIKEQQ